MSKLLIIDTYGLIFRAYHAYPLLTTADGKPTNAIFGVISMLLQTIEKYNPDYLACSLESDTPTFRHVLAHDYKANRKVPDNALVTQIAEIKDLLSFLNIRTLQKDGFEADDVIGSYATQNQDKFDQIQIVTGDRDLYQLLSDKIRILMPGFNFSQITEYDIEKFETKYNIKLEDFVLYKSLIGDASDNIKGIPGVGPKTAEKIVNEFHSIDAILANLDQLPPRIAESIDECKDLWINYYKLSEIDKNVQLDISPEDLKISKINFYKLRNIIDQYEFKSLQKRVAKFLDTFEAKYGGFGLFSDEATEVRKSELKYSVVEKADFSALKLGLPDANPVYVLQRAGLYLFGNGKEFQEIQTQDLYNFIIKTNIKEFIGFDLKPFIKQLLSSGVEKIENYTFFDLSLAWHLIRSDLILSDLNSLVKHLAEDDFEKVYTFTKAELIKLKLLNHNNSDDLNTNLFQTEQALQKVLAHMEWTGIRCDRDYLKTLEEEYKKKIAEIKKDIFELIGFEFNPASTKELGHVLFEVLHLPVIKKTKTQYSTDDSTLTQLESSHGIIALIKQFRMYSKALNTYVLGLQEYIGEDGKIHTDFRQTVVATGRLSSINPNLQNLPTNESIGQSIKRAFTPSSSDKMFLSLDYSQIDLRVLAYESQDKEMIRAFTADEDIHAATAKVVFEKDDITKEERSFAKTINFGIVYGMEPYGLSQALKIDQKNAKLFIDKYLERFNGVKEYFDRITAQLDEKGYVNTFFGRKRFFPTWESAKGFQKKILWREAINMPIQGETSEIIKIAMIRIFDYLRENKINAAQILQIHDEIILEICEDENIEKIKEDIQNIICSAYDIGLPLKASSKMGKDLTFIS